jgi:hypothetical protein
MVPSVRRTPRGDPSKTPSCEITCLRAGNGQAYHLKASITRQISWEGSAGARGEPPNGTFDTTQDMAVREIQSVSR